MSESLRFQLYAIRAIVDGILTTLYPVEPPAGPEAVAGACPKCHAPEDRTVDASTMGGPRATRCLNCGAEWDTV